MRVSVLIAAAILSSGVVHADYSQHPKAATFLASTVDQYGLSGQQVIDALKAAETEPKNLVSMKKSAEKTKTWAQYRKSFVTPLRVDLGHQFIQKHGDLLKKAEQEYGVSAFVIAAILGVETNYGGYTGNVSVLNALATLGFEHPRRSKFFLSELAAFIKLADEQNWNIAEQRGSYAGAMGFSQFMPSNYRTLAVDFDKDGDVDLFSPADAIGSIGRYLQHHGWRSGEPVAVLAKSPKGFKSAAWPSSIKPSIASADLRSAGLSWDKEFSIDTDKVALIPLIGENAKEHWVARHNFYVISRYNPRAKYAMAVYHLSVELAKSL